MKLSWNAITQILGVIGQMINASSFIPQEYKPEIALLLGGITTIVAIVSHQYNPNGTKAVEPYQKGN